MKADILRRHESELRRAIRKREALQRGGLYAEKRGCRGPKWIKLILQNGAYDILQGADVFAEEGEC